MAFISIIFWIIFFLLKIYAVTNMLGVVFVIIVVLYAIFEEGYKRGIFFFLFAMACGLFFEVVGVLYSVPFGPYHYNPVTFLVLGLVPTNVLMYWFVITYTARSITNFMVKTTGKSKNTIVALALIDGLIATAWDLIMDPIMVNIIHFWTWEEGGIFFGVPISNFLGWILVAFLICLVYRFFDNKAGVTTITPILVYAWLDLSMVFIAVSAGHPEYTILGGFAMTFIIIVTLIRKKELFS